MQTYIFYCAEFDHYMLQEYRPNLLFRVKGWKQYVFWTTPPRKRARTFSSTGLTEYVYIGEL